MPQGSGGADATRPAARTAGDPATQSHHGIDEEAAAKAADAGKEKLLQELADGNASRVVVQLPSGSNGVAVSLLSAHHSGEWSSFIGLQSPLADATAPSLPSPGVPLATTTVPVVMTSVPFPEADMVVYLPDTLITHILPQVPKGDGVALLVSAVNSTEGMGRYPSPGGYGEFIEVRAAAAIDLFLLSGPKMNVSGLPNPIRFSLPVNYSSELLCAYWDPSLKVWSTEGVQTSSMNAAGSQLHCETFHLSLFGAIVKGFVDSILCSQFKLLSMDRIGEVGQSSWYSSFGGGVWLCLWLLVLPLALAAHLVDQRRASSRRWLDKYFIITDYSQSPMMRVSDQVPEIASYPEETQLHRSFLLPMIMVMASGCLRIAGCVGGLSGAFRDVLDDLMSTWFEYFGDLRNLIESICQEIGIETLMQFSAARMAQKTMSALVQSTSVRYAGAKMQYNEDLMECALQDKLTPHIINAIQEQKKGTQQNLDYGLNHEGQTEAWDAIFNELPGLLSENLARTSWCDGRLMWSLFVMRTPLGSIFASSIFMSCKMKLFYFLLEFNGALLLSVAFFSASGSVKGKKVSETPSCEVPEAAEAVMYLGRLLALALGSIMIAWLPVAFLQSLQTRRVLPLAPGCRDAKLLRAWRNQDAAVVVVGSGYLLFAAFFVAVFFANLGPEDDNSMATTLLLTVAQEHIFVPVFFSAVIPFLTHVSVRAAGMSHGATSETLQHEVRRSFSRNRTMPLVMDI